jgi:hypothetical protein
MLTEKQQHPSLDSMDKHPPNTNSNPTPNTNKTIPMDHIFSYWIYLWFVIYSLVTFSSVKTPANKFIVNNLNPLLALILALIENLAMFIHLLYVYPNTTIIAKYIGMMLLVKVFPIYELRNTKIRWQNDLFYLFVVFGFYNIYLAIQGTNLIEVYMETYKSIANNKNQTPLFYTLDKFLRWLEDRTGYDFHSYLDNVYKPIENIEKQFLV